MADEEIVKIEAVFFAFGSVYIANTLASYNSIWKKSLYFIMPTLIVVLFVPLIPIVFPILKPIEIKEKAQKYKDLGILKWEDGRRFKPFTKCCMTGFPARHK